MKNEEEDRAENVPFFLNRETTRDIYMTRRDISNI